MEWLRIQLQIFRERGMKAMLIGHVPPARVNSRESWDETCWQKYTLWVRQFRDVVVGSLYGHMNIDHFILQDFDQITKDAKKGKMSRSSLSSSMDLSTVESENALYTDGELTVASASDYLLDLRRAWARLPAPSKKPKKNVFSASFSVEEVSIWQWLASIVKEPGKGGTAGKNRKKEYLAEIGGKFAERYAVANVAPSIVPNYYPTLRIIEYNITGLEHLVLPTPSSHSKDMPLPPNKVPVMDGFSDDEEYLAAVESILKKKRKDKKSKKGKKHPKKFKFKVPNGPSKSTPPGPAYSPQTLTLTGIVQYFANLTEINNDFVNPTQAVEGDLHTGTPTGSDPQSENNLNPETIFGLKLSLDGRLEQNKWKEGKHRKHQGKQPRPKPHPKDFVYEIEYDTKKDKKFPDLTVRRWVEYARRIGQGGSKKSDVEVSEDYDIGEQDELDNEEVDTDMEDTFEEDDEQEDDSEVDEAGKNKKKRSKKPRKGKHVSKAWVTFVKRAFVGTMDYRQMTALFTARSPARPLEQTQDTIEL